MIGIGVPITFPTTSHPVTIQTQAMDSVHVSSQSKAVPPVTIYNGTPDTSCTGSGCGSRHCGIFGCKPDCALFGCGGGCGPLGCIGDSSLHARGGLNCITGSCGYGTDRDGVSQDEDCDEPTTASACTFYVSSYMTLTMTEYSTTTRVRYSHSSPFLYTE